VGRLELLPPSTAAVLREAEQATAVYDALVLTIAIAYGGREEIADAVRDLVRDKAQQGSRLDAIVAEITPSAIDSHLYTVGLPDPDLIIRTSGEIRLSGFLLWQSAQSEFYFSDVNWPEFRKVDFLRAIVVSAAFAALRAVKRTRCGVGRERSRVARKGYIRKHGTSAR
jgi:short-chain Z-isoprenyl diphosphate synthase